MFGTRFCAAQHTRRQLLLAALTLAAWLTFLAAPSMAGMVGMARSSDNSAYWLAGSGGGVFTYPANKPFYGSMGGTTLNAPVVGITSTHTGLGYWLVASDGGVFSFGDAHFHGSMGGRYLNKPVVGMARTPSDGGYWLVASDGGVFSFGSAKFHGSLGNVTLKAPIVGIAATPSGLGYWLLAADGGVFAFGDAQWLGSGATSGYTFTGIAAHPTGTGYWLVTTGGEVFGFGDSDFHGEWDYTAFTGSMGGKVVGIASTAGGAGYWLVGANGNVAAFGTASFRGSRVGNGNVPVVYVHGWEDDSAAKCSQWDDLDTNLTNWGLTGGSVRVSYYWNDDCPNSIDNYPSANPYRHYTHAGKDDEPNQIPKHAYTGPYGIYGHDNDTQIQHLGYHLAWWLYERYSSKGIAVDILAHSMGGVIVRYALARTQLGHPDFPPYLLVDDIVTLSSPHGGANYGGQVIHPGSDEVDQMLATSYFENWLLDNARNPHGRDGTEWTLIGSNNDLAVNQDDAVDMGPTTNKIRYSDGPSHDAMKHDLSGVWDQTVSWWRTTAQSWHAWYDAPHVANWAYFGLALGGGI